ncbi:general odorant-binding protein 19d-like isoform X2 [Choristoneura fumiferana]|uniref:general odorant-binding protein 19d-like isoform X2 n=1 Tax=Choristoneura fumiferana TaxID=7141 RepID=UPI003D157102
MMDECKVTDILGKSEAEVKAYFMKLGIQCSRDWNITPDEMVMMQKHKLPDSENARCLMACVYRKAEWMDGKGMFDVAGAEAMVEKTHGDDTTMIENSKKLFDVCKSVNDETVKDGDKGCDRAEHLFKCLTENANKMGFKI